MLKLKKIHKIILFFVLIFLLGIYSFSLYINYTIDQKKEQVFENETVGFRRVNQPVFEI